LEEVAGGWRRLHNEHVWEMRNEHKILVRKLEGKLPLSEELGVDEKIILE
jgi:hypothetical protein